MNEERNVRVMTIFGTRPEAIKMAPLVRELRERPDIECTVCVTAQHRQMLDQVLDIFGIRPKYDLNIMQPRQSLSAITARCLSGLGEVFEKERPDLVLVHGDTSTTFAGALAAFYQQIRVGHVEAGLRTYDRYSPYPEEMNRVLTTDLADLHFAPTAKNADNLRAEGVKEGVFITGNTVIDAIQNTVRPDYIFENRALQGQDFTNKRVLLVTAHRRENYGIPLENIMQALKALAEKWTDVEIIYPVHLSPVVQECAHRNLDGVDRVRLIDPLSVIDMHNLMARCHLVLTDSGGLQEEAPSLGKPVLVLRQETERPEAVAAGTVRMAGTDKDRIFAMADRLLSDEADYRAMSQAVNPYGDGAASARIADAILYSYGKRPAPPDAFGA